MDDMFEFKGKFYTIKQQKFETRENFMERVWYILNRVDLNVKSFEELTKCSILWSNIKHLKCGYRKDVMEKILF
jgi:hypothetical protein